MFWTVFSVQDKGNIKCISSSYNLQQHIISYHKASQSVILYHNDEFREL